MSPEQERDLDGSYGRIKEAYQMLKTEVKDLDAMGHPKIAEMVKQAVMASNYALTWIIEVQEADKCSKCGNPDIYKAWKDTALCRICFDDLSADAKSVNKELLRERENEL